MSASQVDALLAELLSSDDEDEQEQEIAGPPASDAVREQHEPENALTDEEEELLGDDPADWDLEEGLFEDAEDIELEQELRRLRGELQKNSSDLDDVSVSEYSILPPSNPGDVRMEAESQEPPQASCPPAAEQDDLLMEGRIDTREEIGEETEEVLDRGEGGLSADPPNEAEISSVENRPGRTGEPVLANEENCLATNRPVSTTGMLEELGGPQADRNSKQQAVDTATDPDNSHDPQPVAERMLLSRASQDESPSTSNSIDFQNQERVQSVRKSEAERGPGEIDLPAPSPFVVGPPSVDRRAPPKFLESVDEEAGGIGEEVEGVAGGEENGEGEQEPAWLAEIRAAEESTRLLVEGEEPGSAAGVSERLQDLLSVARQDWNPQGRPDAQSGMIGGAAAVRVAKLNDSLTAALQDEEKYGTQRALCKCYHRPPGSQGYWYVAVGTSQGHTLVRVSTYAGTSQASSPEEVFELGDGQGGEVTALRFSYSGEREKLLMVVGHGKGLLVVWDLAARKTIATITCHAYPITSCCFLPNSTHTPSTIVSADSSGALFYHSLTSWVLRTGVTTKAVIQESRGPTSVNPLIPFSIPVRSSNDGEDVGAKYIREDVKVVAGEGMVCICAPGVCEIGRFWGDGRLVMLYRLPHPDGCPPHEIPCVSWAPNKPGGQRPMGDGGIPTASLAVGWWGGVVLFDIPLLGDWVRSGEAGPGQEQGSRWNYRATRADPNEIKALKMTAQRMPVGLTAMWNSCDPPMPSPSPDFPILSLHWVAAGQLGMLRRLGMMSQFVVFNSHLEVTEQVEIDDCPKSMKFSTTRGEHSWPYASSFGIVSKLTAIGLRGLKVVRLMAWEECLETLWEIGKLKMALHMGMHFFLHSTQKPSRTGSFGSAHLGTRDPARIAQRLSHLLLEFLDDCLKKEDDEIEEKRAEAVADAANISVDLCILLKMTQALFQDVFPRFVASGDKAAFLEVLETAIVRNELSSGVAPEVVQALVEHCCETGQPDKVERCVLRMDIASLDLNQVIRLCLGHQLYVALLYIYSTALLDCTSPALHLVNTISQSQSQAEAKRYALKLIVYLRCCLRGQKYPPGFGSLPPDQAQETREKVFGFLLLTTKSQLNNANRSMRADSRRGSQAGDAFLDGEEKEGGLGSIAEPHPVLRCLLGVDPDGVIWLLKEALSDWDCIEKDLVEAWSGGRVEEMESVRSVTQLVIDILTDLAGDRFGYDSATGESVVVEYVCECVGSGRALVSPEMALGLLEHLSVKAKLNPDLKRQLEGLFVEIVRGVGVQQRFSRSHFRSSASQLSLLQAEKALSLATQSDMMQGMALLHHLSGNYHLALRAFLRDESEPHGAFKYISKALEDGFEGSDSMIALRQAILKCMEDLAGVDPEAAAHMVLRHFPHDQAAVIQGLQGTRPLLFKYLKSAMEAAFAQNLPGEVLDKEMKNVDLSKLLTREHCTMYVGLLCEFDPEAVLPFLKIRDHLVDVEQCKVWCQEYGLREGSAHLLEREGDIEGALDMYLKEVQSGNVQLEEAVLSEGLSLDFANNHIMRAHSLSFLMQGKSTRLTRRQSHPLREVPEVVKNARRALHSAVALCQRNSIQLGIGRDGWGGRGGRSEKEKRQKKVKSEHHDHMLELWFKLLKVYVDRLRQIPQETPSTNTADSSVVGKTIFPPTPPDTPMSQRSLHTITHHELRSAGNSASFISHSPKVALLQDLYTAFMEEIISSMADYIPLRDIVELIVHHHAHERFGDFRGTLLGLMSAYNYERNILKSVQHMINADAFRTLFACYTSKLKSCRIGEGRPGYEEELSEEEEEEEEEGGGAVGENAGLRNLHVAADERGELILTPGGERVRVPLRSRGVAV
ncbi:hypothetical protein BSKO_10875 [Bryopsis sp. KO-2023]|nr:hypothetical protein BSKO_10875 [Bryopsis sp. KO-2023]